MNLEVKLVSGDDDLPNLIRQINSAQWDEENDIDEDEYAVDTMLAFLENQDTISIACFRIDGETSNLAGMASARIMLKPYNFSKWLFIDELDTCKNYRQQGVGTALMAKLLEIAKQNSCEEAWLGTDASNSVANKFYMSLPPSEVEDVVGYTFKI